MQSLNFLSVDFAILKIMQKNVSLYFVMKDNNFKSAEKFSKK